MIGHAIQMLRETAGLTLEEVSKQIGFSRAYLAKVERCELTPTRGFLAAVTQIIAHTLAHGRPTKPNVCPTEQPTAKENH